MHRTFDQMPDADASVGKIYLSILSGSAIVKDITFVTHSLALTDTVTGRRQPGLAMHVPTLTVLNINYAELIRQHHLDIFKVIIDNPQLLVYMDEEDPLALMPSFPEDSTLDKAGIWLDSAYVRHIEVNNMSGRLHSTRTLLELATDSLSVEGHDIGYNFLDSTFVYNDSVYSVEAGSFVAQLPDGITELEVHQFSTSNQGAISVGYTRLRNLFTAKQLADLHREPTTWIDLRLNSLKTSVLNPIRKALAEDYTLDSIEADVRSMHVCRDARYAPKQPFPSPQDVLRKMPIDFFVKHVSASVQSADIEFNSTDINQGKLHVNNLRTSITNVTNHTGATWYCSAHAPFGKQGVIDARYNMHLDKAATFDIKINGKNIEVHDLNSFLRPLVGITCDCHIDHIDADYKGDRNIAKGEFCMQYHGMNVQVHKEDNIPYEIVTKHADTFTQLANTLIPKSNPTAVDPAPRRYQVEWKNDTWKPYPMYLFGPCIDGVIKTMLPGLYVHKQAKTKTKTAQTPKNHKKAK